MSSKDTIKTEQSAEIDPYLWVKFILVNILYSFNLEKETVFNKW